jgi:very-short-patch-repair endonuclease
MNSTVAALLTDHGVITVSRHPGLSRTLHRLVAKGVLERPLPGVFVPAGSGYEGWLRAVTAWAGTEGALHDATAASLWLDDPAPAVLQLAHPTLRSQGRIRVWRHAVEPELVVTRAGIRTVTAAYAAVELAAWDDGRATTEALRRRLATTEQLRQALISLDGTSGQKVRRRVVESCLSNPWSYAELRLHRMLREAGITGWVANAPHRVGGRVFHPDLLFAAARLVVEFDGRAFHSSRTEFTEDRERQNVYIAHGYLVLRFAWHHLDDPDYVLGMLRKALALRVA